MKVDQITLSFDDVLSSWIRQMAYVPSHSVLVVNMCGVYYAYKNVSDQTMEKLKKASSILIKLQEIQNKYNLDEEELEEIKSSFLGELSFNQLKLKTADSEEVKNLIKSDLNWFLSVITTKQKGGLMGTIFRALNVWTDEPNQYIKFKGKTKDLLEKELMVWLQGS